MKTNSGDMTPFQNSVVDALSVVGEGYVTTYKNISIAIGRPGASQAAHNAVKVAVRDYGYNLPWHRIVRANGQMYLNPNFNDERIAKLQSEGIEVSSKGRVINLEQYLYDYEQ